MAALAMVSSVAVFAAVPAAVSSQASFSAVSNVRMVAPLRVTRRMSVIRRANPQKTEDLKDKVRGASTFIQTYLYTRSNYV